MNWFNRPSIADLYRANLETAKKEIMSAPDRRIVETDSEDLVAYYYSKYKLTPIAIDEARRQARMRLGAAESIRDQYHAEEGLPCWNV